MKKHISLSLKCPYCLKSLMDESYPLHGSPSIKLNIESQTDRGTIHLCSIFECFDHEADIKLEKGKVVDFTCPHCNKELLVKEECKICGAPMVSLLLDTGGRVNICSRNGCPNHYIAFEDLEIELTRFYEQYEN